MHLDGRFEPLTALAELVALVGVASVAWYRHVARKPLTRYDAVGAAALHRTLTAGLGITGPRTTED